MESASVRPTKWFPFATAVLLASCSAGADVAAARTPAKVPYSAIAEHLEWVGVAVSEPDYTIWGAAPIQGDDGKTHLFVARWPEPNVDPAWRKSSEIAHYVAEKPEGPFRYLETVVRGTHRAGDWNAWSAHNPEIKKFGNTYALFYISNSDYHQPPHPRNQAVGLVTAPSLDGPWTPAGTNGLVLDDSPDPAHWTHGWMVVNPAAIKIGNRFHLYFKSRYGGSTVYGLATSTALDGPYRMEPEPLTGKGMTIEDASVFEWDGKICLLTTDNHGQVTGVRGGGALWVSDDGRHFNPRWVQVGYDCIPALFAGYNPAKCKHIYGGQPKIERPKILMIDGKPAYLYGPSGWAVHGGPRTACYVMRINLPPEASPLPKASLTP